MDEFDFELPPDDDIDDLLEDEDELDVLREIENQKPATVAPNSLQSQSVTKKPNEEDAENIFKEFENEATEVPVILKSPQAKRPRLNDDFPALDDVTNVFESVDTVSSQFRPSQTPSFRLPRVGERKVYKRIPLDCDYQSVTMMDGERFYMRMKSERDQQLKEEDVTLRRGDTRRLGLCGQPFSTLLEQAIEEQCRIQQQMATAIETVQPMEIDSGFSSSSDDESAGKSTLWVEKFRPRSYMQLLSDDGTNRTLLTWLKLWDKVVYGKEEKKPKKPKAEELGQGDGKGSKPNFKPAPGPSDVIEELDDSDRPQQKTALLYGPPGLGKTTLAHVVATHAGYNVVEMNASDDRSLQVSALSSSLGSLLQYFCFTRHLRPSLTQLLK